MAWHWQVVYILTVLGYNESTYQLSINHISDPWKKIQALLQRFFFTKSPHLGHFWQPILCLCNLRNFTKNCPLPSLRVVPWPSFFDGASKQRSPASPKALSSKSNSSSGVVTWWWAICGWNDGTIPPLMTGIRGKWVYRGPYYCGWRVYPLKYGNNPSLDPST